MALSGKYILGKAVSVLVLTAFMVSACAGPVSGRALAWAEQRPSQDKEFDIEYFTIPSHLGSIEDISTPKTHKTLHENTIIHIQDAHCDYAAQHAISEIIDHLVINYGIDTVNLEGAEGLSDLSVFRNVDDIELRDRVADYFVKKGIISGAEYYAINKPGKVLLWGIEDASLYRKNLDIYREALPAREAALSGLSKIRQATEVLKKRMFSCELSEIDVLCKKYRSGKVEFREFVVALFDAARKQDITLHAFPVLIKFRDVLKEENAIDFKQAMIEREGLIDMLSKKLSRNEMEELTAKTAGFASGLISEKEYYRYLLKQSKSIGGSSHTPGELTKFANYSKKCIEINSAELFKGLKYLDPLG